ncbi:OLC1v1022720C1 [Oldenlandia corymbosa var. corymbosa]|uniref:OLC1v1022720C1 n=1 Tax=Oldenlandia corymbosa var. corymbosa TaxID=529605 RepID=A0AAV1BYG1_OLDCO|nr:OLC1v1022720C1 [Oldenlandia corymbosa var. corymbosa]
MGNCMNTNMKQSSLIWGGDDWGSPLPEETAGSEFSGKSCLKTTKKADLQEQENSMMEKEKGITSSFHDSSSTKTTGSPTEVKIKITKKQLEEILKKVDIDANEGQSLAQVLTQLINLGSMDPGFQEERPKSWRPSLHSIPESEVY